VTDNWIFDKAAARISVSKQGLERSGDVGKCCLFELRGVSTTTGTAEDEGEDEDGPRTKSSS